MDFNSTTTYPTDPYYTLTEAETLDFANAVRAAGGGDVIAALKPATPAVANACLIALALNFSSEIEPSDTPLTRSAVMDRESEFVKPRQLAGIWTMSVGSRETAAAIGAALNLPVILGGAETLEASSVVLPVCVANVARAFDALAEETFDTEEERADYISAGGNGWVGGYFEEGYGPTIWEGEEG